MRKHILLLHFLLFSIFVHAQYFDRSVTTSSVMDHFIQQISTDKNIDADSVVELLLNWNNYPVITKTGREYIYFYEDSFYGNIPLRVFIPSSYKNTSKNPMLLSLHGAVGASSFERVTQKIQNINTNELDYDPFFDTLSTKNFIIVRPYADPAKKFNWVVNEFGGQLTNNTASSTNRTFDILVRIIRDIKRFLNVDDEKIFSIGHSDGSDGAFALAVYKPTIFAGFACYNSMLTNIYANNIYLQNTINRPLYTVHSDLDDLRPIEQTREIIKQLKKINAAVEYKEYKGFKHFDKHLSKDISHALEFFGKTNRNPFPKNIYWETNDLTNNQCDWLRIVDFNLNLHSSRWQKEVNVKRYDKLGKNFDNEDYYQLAKSCAIKAHYENNVFTIETSRVENFEILISPKMVNIQLPVKVIVNGKIVFDTMVKADKEFLLENFRNELDRQAVWVAVINLKAIT